MIFMILSLVYVLCGLAQASAFVAGMNGWLGLGALLSAIAMLVLGILPLGSILASAIAFYGAVAVWGWNWWQAALLTLPFAVLGIFTMGTPPALRLPRLTIAPNALN